jgi:DNA-3-methyladenine glycosylase II
MAGALSAEALALAERDPTMAALIGRIGPKSLDDRRSQTEDPFVALARIITGQQVSTGAARKIWGRICGEFGGRPPTAAEARDGEQRLRSCGLSGRKASYIAGLAAAIAAGELEVETLEHAEDEIVIEELVKIRGIGRWSGEMFLMSHLGREDVFSGGDLGLRNGIRIAHKLEATPSPEEATAIAERWRPHRTLAAVYLWAAVAVELPE